MLELYEYDAMDSADLMAVLDEAANVRVTKEINTTDELTFTYPLASDKAEFITVNRMILCEGQFYRIMRTQRGSDVLTAECIHRWYADAPSIHIPSVPDSIGVTPYNLVHSAAASAAQTARFNIIGSAGVDNMRWIGMGDFMKNTAGDTGADFKIDFFAVDKTNLLDFVKTVIENAGFGEIYYDNTRFAIVERLGKETNIRLELSSNMENIKTETDISSMVTRLYPYGNEDMTIGSVYGKNYIDSPNMSIYGLKSGYKDYSDYTDVNDLYHNARWEFDAQNPERIDVPSVSVTGSAWALAPYSSGGDIGDVSLGDTVKVIDERGAEMTERVIAISYYPYENKPADITIGRVKRDLYFYISQISELAKRYSKCSTTSGKISPTAISGTRQTAYASAKEIGLEYNGKVTSLTAGEDGVYIDGRKIITEGEGE